MSVCDRDCFHCIYEDCVLDERPSGEEAQMLRAIDRGLKTAGTTDEKKLKRRKYYEANRERILAQMKEYRKEAGNRISESQKLYYRENREKISARKHEYYLEHKDEFRERDKAYYQKNREKILARKKEKRLAKKEAKHATNKA